MSAASSIAAAKSCARTILFESLRVSLFKGAIPHVMLIVDKEPNVIGKQLVEGYRLALDEYNVSPSYHEDTRRAEKGELLIPLTKGVTAPSGSVGLVTDSKISYSVVPFEHENFLENMQALQALLRDCGNQSVAEGPFQDSITRLRSYLTPLRDTVNDEALANALRHGPQRELLAFILIQKEAFQNEMKKYRLRLNLFDLGARVAEHCHLYSMSADADRLAESGAFVEALNDDQVYSYSRSCSLEPRLTYTLGTAIADAIDALSWRRQPTEGASVKPLESFDAALEDQQVWELFQPGALRWEGKKERCKGSTIVGVGEPLHIVCRDESKVLSFVGGMEDCLLNTGHYPAADSEERNSVVEHRNRFKVERKEAVEEEKEKENVIGRLKKKDYLAKLKAEGLKPNKKKRVDSDDEEAATHERGANIFTSIGGTFPVGEVISESFDLSKLNGECTVFAYPDAFKDVAMSKPQPFTMTIQKGVVTELSESAPEDFVDLLSLVRQAEGDCYVRELGIGLNPFVGLNHMLKDVTSFERQWGVHLSLGQRHPLFVKQSAKRNEDGTVAEDIKIEGPVLKRKAGKYHIDVFVDVKKLKMGDFEVDFSKGVAVA